MLFVISLYKLPYFQNPSGYVSMYDRIKTKSKSDKEHDDDEDKDEESG